MHACLHTIRVPDAGRGQKMVSELWGLSCTAAVWVQGANLWSSERAASNTQSSSFLCISIFAFLCSVVFLEQGPQTAPELIGMRKERLGREKSDKLWAWHFKEG